MHRGGFTSDSAGMPEEAAVPQQLNLRVLGKVGQSEFGDILKSELLGQEIIGSKGR